MSARLIRPCVHLSFAVLVFCWGCSSGGLPSTDLCDGVDCSGHGTCIVVNGSPLCECEGEYVESGLACIEPDGDADADQDVEADGDLDEEVEPDADADADADADEDVQADADPEADADPPTCGDGVCNGDEDACSCTGDCTAACGDGCCTGDETFCDCEDDCAAACGDGCCTDGETQCDCPDDCLESCGDACCSGDETPALCPDDCDPVCGDDACTHDEDACDCPDDCEATCGDECCTHGEDTCDCPDDCDPTCGDGCCGGEEDTLSCPWDCGCFDGDLDDFDDGDAVGWTAVSGTWSVVSDGEGFEYRQGSTSNPDGTDGPHVSFFDGQVFSDLRVSVDMSYESGSPGFAAMGIVYRYIDYDNYYWVYLHPNFSTSNPFTLVRRYQGVSTQIASAPAGNGGEHRMTVDVRGDRHILSRDGRVFIEHTDAFLRTGHVGLGTISLAGTYDNVVLDDCFGCRQVFFDDFNDDDISDWTEGSLYDDGPRANVPRAHGGVYVRDPAGDIGGGGHYRSLPVSVRGTAFEVRARVRAGVSVHGQTSFGVFADDTTAPGTSPPRTSGHGYWCVWYPNLSRASIHLVNEDSGEMLAEASVPRDDDWHHLSCVHLTDGAWEIRLDGTPQTLTTNVADTTYRSFDFVSIYLDPATDDWALDDIEVLDCSGGDEPAGLEPFLSMPGRRVGAITYDDGSLWVTHAAVEETRGRDARVAQIDVESRAVVAESAELELGQRGIAFGAGSVWVGEWDNTIRRIDSVGLTVTGSFRTPGDETNGMAFDGANLWLWDPFSRYAYEVTTGGAIVSRFGIPGHSRTGLEWEGEGLWVDTADDEISHYTRTGTMGATLTVTGLPEGQSIFDIAFSDTNLFVTTQMETIYFQRRPDL